jgi:hypothetical protein
MRKGMAQLLAAGAIGASLLAGCGDGEENPTSAGEENDRSGATSAASTDARPGTGGGGSEAADSTDDQTISKADFAKQANQICRKTLRNVTEKTVPIIEREGKRPGNDPEELEVRLVSSIMAPELRAELEQLQDLGVPSGDEKQVNTILNAIEGVVVEAETNAAKVVKYNTALVKPSNLAKQYGISECPYG